jgi:hypothetical protein
VEAVESKCIIGNTFYRILGGNGFGPEYISYTGGRAPGWKESICALVNFVMAEGASLAAK